MTTDTIREKAERALLLYNLAAPHIKAREQCQLLGELAREWLRDHPEDDGEPIDRSDAMAFNEAGHETPSGESMQLVEQLHSKGHWFCIGGAGAVVLLETNSELRRLLAALGVE